MSMTYHKKANVITCICGVVIRGVHTCNTQVSKITIVECNYDSVGDGNGRCLTCVTKEQECKYLDQWTTDESGYCICEECGDKCDGFLPKICNCSGFIDTDGEVKCKSCFALWVDPDIETGQCDICGYMGE